MKVVVDTNVMVRLLVKDHEEQFMAAFKLFEKAEEIIIPTHVFCELEWVLSAAYKFKQEDIADKFRSMMQSHKVVIKEDEVEAGLRMLEKGGDFSDGINAYTGQVMARGVSVFVSFDKQAVRLLTEQGISALLPL